MASQWGDANEKRNRPSYLVQYIRTWTIRLNGASRRNRLEHLLISAKHIHSFTVAAVESFLSIFYVHLLIKNNKQYFLAHCDTHTPEPCQPHFICSLTWIQVHFVSHLIRSSCMLKVNEKRQMNLKIRPRWNLQLMSSVALLANMAANLYEPSVLADTNGRYSFCLHWVSVLFIHIVYVRCVAYNTRQTSAKYKLQVMGLVVHEYANNKIMNICTVGKKSHSACWAIPSPVSNVARITSLASSTTNLPHNTVRMHTFMGYFILFNINHQTPLSLCHRLDFSACKMKRKRKHEPRNCWLPMPSNRNSVPGHHSDIECFRLSST